MYQHPNVTIHDLYERALYNQRVMHTANKVDDMIVAAKEVSRLNAEIDRRLKAEDLTIIVER